MKKRGNARENISKKQILNMKKEKSKKQDDVSKVQKNILKTQKKKFKEQYKKEKLKKEEKVTEINRKKRMKVWIICTALIFSIFIARIGWIQFVQGDELQQMAQEQQTADRAVNPRRGTIYDATGTNILAVSSTVNTITVNPVNISKDNKEKVARALADIFDLDYETVLKKVKKRSSIENIVKRVEKDKADELRIWLSSNGIEAGVNIDEDTKRYYPYNNLASQVIGFCGADNQGLDGIEAVYEETLKGEKGKIVKMTDASRWRS